MIVRKKVGKFKVKRRLKCFKRKVIKECGASFLKLQRNVKGGYYDFCAHLAMIGFVEMKKTCNVA